MLYWFVILPHISILHIKFPQVSQSNSPYYLWSKNDTKVIFMNVVFLAQNLGDKVNRAGGTKRLQGLVIQICQIYSRDQWYKKYQTCCCIQLFWDEKYLFLYSVILFHFKTGKVITLFSTNNELTDLFLKKKVLYWNTIHREGNSHLVNARHNAECFTHITLSCWYLVIKFQIISIRS